ncbi:MAG: hypothetical protein ACM3VT_19655, partial [Solirubrobacterales bacterium]
LRAVVQFVMQDIGWTTRRWLPSTMALIPIVYLLAKVGTGSFHSPAKKVIRHYLLVSGLRSLFRGTTETQVNTFVNAVRDSRGDCLQLAHALFNRIPKNRLFKMHPEDVRNTAGLYSPLMQVYLAYLFANDARSWPSGRRLKDILHDGLASDPLGVHHIFPKQFMIDLDFPVERLNTAANYAILSQADNSELADRDPFDVWRSLKQNQKECASQQLCFVASDNYLRPAAYGEYMDFRAAKMTEQLNEFLDLG